MCDKSRPCKAISLKTQQKQTKQKTPVEPKVETEQMVVISINQVEGKGCGASTIDKG